MQHNTIVGEPVSCRQSAYMQHNTIVGEPQHNRVGEPQYMQQHHHTRAGGEVKSDLIDLQGQEFSLTYVCQPMEDLQAFNGETMEEMR